MSKSTAKQTRRDSEMIRVLPSTHYRIKAHARRSDLFICDYVDSVVPSLPAPAKRKVRK